MQPEKTTGILSLPQKQINRQLYEMIMKAGSGEGGDPAEINAILKRLKKIEDEMNIDKGDRT